MLFLRDCEAYPDKWSFDVKLAFPIPRLGVEFSLNRCQLDEMSD